MRRNVQRITGNFRTDAGTMAEGELLEAIRRTLPQILCQRHGETRPVMNLRVEPRSPTDEEVRRCQEMMRCIAGRSPSSRLKDPPEPDLTGPIDYRYSYDLEPCPACLVEASRVPQDYWQCSFENFETPTEGHRTNLARGREYAADPAGLLILVGGVGSGKTHLAVACLRARGGGYYAQHREIVASLRESYRHDPSKRYRGAAAAFGSERVEVDDPRIGGLPTHDTCWARARSAPVFEACRDEKFLVLDELGVAVAGNDAETILFDILDHRITSHLPTILATNTPAEVLKDILGDRLADRLRMAAFGVLAFNGPSYRERGNRAYLARAREAGRRRS